MQSPQDTAPATCIAIASPRVSRSASGARSAPITTTSSSAATMIVASALRHTQAPAAQLARSEVMLVRDGVSRSTAKLRKRHAAHALCCCEEHQKFA